MRAQSFSASIFDMDGLLVDSERLWHQAEIEVLGALGVPLAADQRRLTKGMVVEEVALYWFERYPWAGESPEEVAARVVDRVIELVLTDGRLQAGAETALELCHHRGLPLALASSSQYRLIEAVLGHFDLEGHFALVHSAQDEPYGKPHPGVFITTAGRLGVPPARCVVWEDSSAGVLAAKAARMACVAVPEAVERESSAFAIADAVLGSLEEVDDALLDTLAAVHFVDPLAGPGRQRPAARGAVGGGRVANL